MWLYNKTMDDLQDEFAREIRNYQSYEQFINYFRKIRSHRGLSN